MEEIVKKSNLQPVAFGRQPVPITKGQELIIHLLKESITESRIINREDIEKCYFAFLQSKCNGYRVKDGMIQGKYEYPSDKVKYNSMAWFKNNLGTCILKGKLLAIPVIEHT